jgi:hypothetical protein
MARDQRMWYYKVGHVLPPFTFFIASLVIFLVIRGNERLDQLDRVTLYKYTKASVDRDKALRNNSVADAQWAWLGDKDDTARCLDMTRHNYPRVSFQQGSDPTGPTCLISLGAVPVQGQANKIEIMSSFSTTSTVGCRPGTYQIKISGGTGGPIAGPLLFIGVQTEGTGEEAKTQVSVTIPNPQVDVGSSAYTAGSLDAWSACLVRRVALAQQFLGNTSCANESSQLCSCVYAFAGKVLDPSRKLKAVLAKGETLQDVLLGGVDQCIKLRRVHDVREASSGVYVRSWALLTFALALFFNSILYLVDRMESQVWTRLVAHVVCFFLLFFAFLNNADPSVVLAVLLPVLLLMAYDLYVSIWVAPSDLMIGAQPYLHPVAFSVCLCNLTLFTLVERGVVQSEYLLVEVIKCHAIAAVYAANAWYHRYRCLVEDPKRESMLGRAEAPGLLTSNVEAAQRLLFVVALAAAADTLLIPYPTKVPFQLHWLLPLAFVYISLTNPSWAHALLNRMRLGPTEPESILRGSDGYFDHFNALAAVMVFSVGLVLMGYFIVDHIRAFGAEQFPYASYLVYPSLGSPETNALPLLVRAM